MEGSWIIQVTQDTGLHLDGSSGGGENWLGPGYISRIGLIGSADGLDGGIREKEESKVTPKIFGYGFGSRDAIN